MASRVCLAVSCSRHRGHAESPNEWSAYPGVFDQ